MLMMMMMPCHSQPPDHSSLFSCHLHLPAVKPEAHCPYVSLQISFPSVSRSLGHPLRLWPCGIHCSTCLAMLSSLRLSVWPIQFYLFLQRSKTGCSLVFFHSSFWLFCLASVYSESFSVDRIQQCNIAFVVLSDGWAVNVQFLNISFCQSC